jgi:hypothetical protein
MAMPFPQLPAQTSAPRSRWAAALLGALAAPREHLLWGEALPPSNFGNHRARSKCLPNHLRLKIVRELSPPTRPRDHLYPANRRHFRLKLMVKRRHEPISHSEISTLDHHPAS